MSRGALAILYAHMGLADAFRREIALDLEQDPSSDLARTFDIEGFVLLGEAEEALALAKHYGKPNSAARLPMSLLSLGRFDEARAAADARARPNARDTTRGGRPRARGGGVRGARAG